MNQTNQISSLRSVSTSISSASPFSLASLSFSHILNFNEPNFSFSSITSPFRTLFSCNKVSCSTAFYFSLSFADYKLPDSLMVSSFNFFKSIFDTFSSSLYFKRSFSSYSLNYFASFFCRYLSFARVTKTSFFSLSNRLFSSSKLTSSELLR